MPIEATTLSFDRDALDFLSSDVSGLALGVFIDFLSRSSDDRRQTDFQSCLNLRSPARLKLANR